MNLIQIWWARVDRLGNLSCTWITCASTWRQVPRYVGACACLCWWNTTNRNCVGRGMTSFCRWCDVCHGWWPFILFFSFSSHFFSSLIRIHADMQKNNNCVLSFCFCFKVDSHYFDCKVFWFKYFFKIIVFNFIF